MSRAFPSHHRPWLLAIGLAAIASLIGCLDIPSEVPVTAAIVDTCSGVVDGALCNDQNTCTTTDRCQNGLCVGISAVDGTACTDGNQCTRNDICNKGLCEGAAVAEGTLCTDGEPCTDVDACRMGRCMPGAPRVCDDGIACTMDECVIGMGCRSVVTAACPDGDAGGSTDGDPNGDALPPVDASDSGGPDRQDALDVDAGGGPDADGGSDTPDAMDGSTGGDATADAVDADDPLDPDASAPLFEARGGACVCEIASAHSPSTTLFGFALAALVLTGRRRRS